MTEDLDAERKLFQEAQTALKMAVFEAVRAPSINRYKLEEAIKKYLETQNSYLGRIHDRLAKLSGAKSTHEPPPASSRAGSRTKV